MNSKILKSCFIYTLSFLLIFPATYAQNKEVKFPKESLKSRVQQIAKKSGKNIIFDGELLDKIQVPPLIIPNGDMDQALKRSLVATGFIMKTMSDGSIVIRKEETLKKEKPAGTGRISGRVTDEKGEPIPGATVIIPGTGKGVVTDLNGTFTLQTPSGETTIEVSFLSYQKKKITGIDVRPDKTTKLDVALSEASEQLSEVTVTAQVQRASTIGMLLQQKAAISMTDGISAELIKKTSDNNVAQVLKRVAGVTINEGKFVTVRGMGERYNNVQLNGSSLPSTEPNRRNFSFDIIPSTLIDNVTVSKTFTPDLPGEFTGGLVQVKTLSIPDTKFFNLTVGTGGNTISTGKEFQTNKRYAADYLQGEMANRSWFAGGADQLAQSITNAGQINHYSIYKYTAAPLQNYSLSFGLPMKINEKHSIGLVAALTYRHEETKENLKELHTFSRDPLLSGMGDEYNNIYKFVTALGAVANLGWKTTNHTVTWRNLFNNRFTHTTMNRFIYDIYDTHSQFEVYSTPLQSRLMQTQLDGEHAFFGQKLKITWNADYNTTARVNPDDRYACADVNPGTLVVNPSSNGNYLFDWSWGVGPSNPYTTSQFVMYSGLEEVKKNAGINAEYKFGFLKQTQKLKTGLLRSQRQAEYNQQYLHAYRSGSGSLDGTSLNAFYDPSNFSSGLLYYEAGGFSDRSADYYLGHQTIDAAYLMADMCPIKPLHIIAGIRVENAVTKMTTLYSWYDSNAIYHDQDSTFTRTDESWLPSLTAIYAFSSSFNVRAAYSKTLARPDFRELTDCQYWNVSERIQMINKKAVEQSTAKNYDIRLEWYPSAGEVVSLSAFYKDFDKPVEKVARVRSDAQNYDLLTVNLKQAILRGVELNFRKSFDFLTPVLKNLWLSANGTMIEGNIDYENWAGKRERPLQGLAPYNINGSLTYEDARFGAAVNYTRVGRTLVIGGDLAEYDFYENPRNVLDLQLSARFLKQRLEIKLNASDILNEDVITYCNSEPQGYTDRTALGMDYNAGDWVISRSNKGVNYSFSVSYKF